jgi:hypothetical protein
LNRRSRRIVVDALPPRAAGRMCSIDGRRPYRNATSCHVNRRGGGCATILPVAQGMLWSQIRPSIGIRIAVSTGATDRTDTTHGAHVDLHVGVHRVVIARQETRKYRGTHGNAGVGKQRSDQTTTNHVTKELIHVDHHIHLESASHQ